MRLLQLFFTLYDAAHISKCPLVASLPEGERGGCVSPIDWGGETYSRRLPALTFSDDAFTQTWVKSPESRHYSRDLLYLTQLSRDLSVSLTFALVSCASFSWFRL